MDIQKSKKIYCCCGKYFACTDAVINKKVYCTSCKKLLKTTVTMPHIYIVKS